jgi:hypothetical protein
MHRLQMQTVEHGRGFLRERWYMDAHNARQEARQRYLHRLLREEVRSETKPNGLQKVVSEQPMVWGQTAQDK